MRGLKSNEKAIVNDAVCNASVYVADGLRKNK